MNADFDFLLQFCKESRATDQGPTPKQETSLKRILEKSPDLLFTKSQKNEIPADIIPSKQLKPLLQWAHIPKEQWIHKMVEHNCHIWAWGSLIEENQESVHKVFKEACLAGNLSLAEIFWKHVEDKQEFGHKIISEMLKEKEIPEEIYSFLFSQIKSDTSWLHEAIKNQNASAVHAFLKHQKISGSDDKNPFHIAAQIGDHTIFQLLIDHYTYDPEGEKLAKNHPPLPWKKDAHGKTPIDYAAGSEEITEILNTSLLECKAEALRHETKQYWLDLGVNIDSLFNPNDPFHKQIN